MDTSQQATVNARDREGLVAGQRQRRSIAEKRRIVEETVSPGASVARIARVHGVNTNQVFGWRRLYLAGAAARDGVAARAREQESVIGRSQDR
jgi:transposase-like protein